MEMELKSLIAEQQSCGWSLAKSAPASGVQNLHFDRQRQAEEALLPFCSFPEVRRHPRQATLEAQSQAWLANLCQGLMPVTDVKRLLDKRVDTLGCVFYPHGFSDARSLTLGKLAHWFILLDDVMDDPSLFGHSYEAGKHFACRQFSLMFGGDMTAMSEMGLFDPADAQSGVFSDPSTAYSGQQELVMEVGAQWVQEMRLLGMSPTQLQRLPEAVADYLAGMVGMIRLRQEKRVPELDEYIHLRRMDGARKLYTLGCEFDLGIELDKKTLEHPLMRELHKASSDQLLWINDLLSFQREFEEEDYVSLLAVLRCRSRDQAAVHNTDVAMSGSKPLDFAETLEEACSMIKRVDQERVHLAAEVEAWRPDLKPYVQAINFTITGINFWSLWSQRN